MALILAAAAPASAQDISQALTSTLSGRSYQPAYIFFTAQGSEAILNLSRVNRFCTSTTSCASDPDCAVFPGSTCGGSPLRCQVPVDGLIGQVAVIEVGLFCEIAACAGVAVSGCRAACPGGQTYCGTQGSCHTCPAAENLCLCDGGATCGTADAALGPAGVALEDGFDDGSNPNQWLLQGSQIDPSLDSRLVLGPSLAPGEINSAAVAWTRFRLVAGGAYVLFVKHAVNPRQSWAECSPPHLGVFLTSRPPEWCDLDDDGHSGTDCDPNNGQAWAIPGEAQSVLLTKVGGVANMSWAQPSSLGGTPAGTTYRVYAGSRSDLPSLLNGNADSCLVAVTSGLSTAIPGNPPSGTLAWYLVRAGNSCGEGTAGSATAGPRIQNARDCDDGIPCTIDSCDPSLGCVHTPSAAACDDANPCTTDSCNPSSGCVHINNTGPSCNDGNACTTNDTCSGGVCVGGPSLGCDDGNVCTDDSCNPASGCVHTNNTLPCDDGNACTTGDGCSGGVCSGNSLPAASHLVISQIQTAGDGASAADDEFIEIYNPTASAISLSGRSLQYKAATGSTYVVHALPAQSVPAHGWFLVARSAYNGSTPSDQTVTAFLMAAAGGTVFIVNSTTQLSGTCSQSFSILDKVGWGTANCSEGAPAPAPAANNSILRKPGGSCGNGQDINDNNADFQDQVPSTPRNRFSTPQP